MACRFCGFGAFASIPCPLPAPPPAAPPRASVGARGVTRSVALVPATAVALYMTKSPRVGSQMNEWLNILQSVQLPFALLPLLHLLSHLLASD